MNTKIDYLDSDTTEEAADAATADPRETRTGRCMKTVERYSELFANSRRHQGGRAQKFRPQRLG